MYVSMYVSMKLVCIHVMYVCIYVIYVCIYIYASYMYIMNVCICTTCMYICVCVCVHRDDTNFASTFHLPNSSTAATYYFCRYKPAPR